MSPNPQVGAVIVKENKVIATGYHRKFGAPHAEADALKKLKKHESKDATCVVTLEPCCFYGKTPPCTELLIKMGIRRVVIGMPDPNPLVSGGGISRLKEAGIDVFVGVLEKECLELNKAFVKYMKKKLPYVTIKIAQTLDGKIALENGASKWISSEISRNRVQRLRREHDAVLVGIGTILTDNPYLTLRKGKNKVLKRIILDTHLRIPLNSRVLSCPDPQNTLILCGEHNKPEKTAALQSKQVQVFTVKKNQQGHIHLQTALGLLGKSGITSLLVEGGSTIATSFLIDRLADRLLVFIAPKLFGNGLTPFQDLGLTRVDDAMQFRTFAWKKSGPDILFEGRF